MAGSPALVGQDEHARLRGLVVEGVAGKVQQMHGRILAQTAAQMVQGGRVQPFQDHLPLFDAGGQGLSQTVPLAVQVQGVHAVGAGQHAEDAQGPGGLQGRGRVGQFQIAQNGALGGQGEEALSGRVVQGFPGQRGQFRRVVQTQTDAQGGFLRPGPVQITLKQRLRPPFE